MTEKSQCQALERTQPGLPLGLGHVRTTTRHTHKEWLRFLRHVEEETPADLDLHLILDNYATLKHPKVLRWLAKRPRFHLHFTPTRSSWLNLVERFFRDLTVDVVHQGSFTKVKELVYAMTDYLAERNLQPTRYQWRARGADILAKIQRARQKLAEIKNRT